MYDQDVSAVDEDNDRGYLLKRKDYIESDKNARSHPNRTYFFKSHDLDQIILTCTKKLQVIVHFSCIICLLIRRYIG